MSTYKLVAHTFTIEHGSVQTALFVTKGTALVEAATFDELETRIQSFGAANAPCNVWVHSKSPRTPRGFDAWAFKNGASRWLFHDVQRCQTAGCDRSRAEGFKFCEPCLTAEPLEAPIAIDDEGTLDHFNRFVAGDR